MCNQAVVAVAQLVEPRIVIPVVAGSIPVSHPIFLYFSPLLFALSAYSPSLFLVFISCIHSFLLVFTVLHYYLRFGFFTVVPLVCDRSCCIGSLQSGML